MTENQKRKIIRVELLETFAEIADTLYGSPMGASGQNHAPGQVPDPGATAGTSKFLREDGTWLDPLMEDPFAGYEYVNMGLPSGILWATCNIGATSPEQAGLYFSCGNVEGHTTTDGFEGIETEYNLSHGSTLGATDNIPATAEYDAAVANMGSGWRMPTTQEIQELFNDSYTTHQWTTRNGMNGYLVTSKSNGNSIFLPAAGYFYEGFVDFGEYGYYWSSSFSGELRAYNLIFGNGDVYPDGDSSRYSGCSVRAVHTSASPLKVVLRTEVGTANGVASLDGSGKVTSSQLPDITGPTINKTWSELKAMRDSGTLVPGQFYRITDYQCTTTQENTQSAGHQFDIIVRADDVNVLNENAYAALHEGDTYFTSYLVNMSAWELKYCLDNDIQRFSWVDTTNGKGVIYYMKDEWCNEAPYDFKNIQFFRYKEIVEDEECYDSPINKGYNDYNCCYTFNDAVQLNIDGSLSPKDPDFYNKVKFKHNIITMSLDTVHGNRIALPNIVFMASYNDTGYTNKIYNNIVTDSDGVTLHNIKNSLIKHSNYVIVRNINFNNNTFSDNVNIKYSNNTILNYDSKNIDIINSLNSNLKSHSENIDIINSNQVQIDKSYVKNINVYNSNYITITSDYSTSVNNYLQNIKTEFIQSKTIKEIINLSGFIIYRTNQCNIIYV